MIISYKVVNISSIKTAMTRENLLETFYPKTYIHDQKKCLLTNLVHGYITKENYYLNYENQRMWDQYQDIRIRAENMKRAEDYSVALINEQQRRIQRLEEILEAIVSNCDDARQYVYDTWDLDLLQFPHVVRRLFFDSDHEMTGSEVESEDLLEVE